MYGVLRDRYKESKRIAGYCYSTNRYKDIRGEITALTIGLIIMSVILFFSINVSCIDKGADACNLNFTGSTIEGYLSIAPILIMLIYLAVFAVDDLIEFYSKKITDNDVTIDNFIGKKVFGKNHEGFDDSYSYFIFLTVNVGIVWGIWFTVMWPTLVWVWILFGGHYALVKLANLVYRTSKRLRNHENDPDAHKKD